MRRISLNEISDEMLLAKPIYQGTQLILDRGINGLSRFTDKLNNMGIFSVYIEDELSADIEIPDAVCEQTREHCLSSIHSVFSSLQQQGNFDSDIIDDAIETLLQDLFSRKDILISLSQIATIDDGTMVHSVNTTIYCVLIGKKYGLTEDELRILAEGAILHDVGKIGLDENILLKASSLSTDEYSHIKEHPALGYALLRKNEDVPELARLIALQHHERLDGSGYPNGLKREEIHILSQITAVADVYDALTTERCYRKCMSNVSAFRILQKDADDGKLNANLLPLLFEHVALYPNGIIVHLSDGTHGIVKSQNPGQPGRPMIRVIDDINEPGKVSLYDLDLSECLDVKIVDE